MSSPEAIERERERELHLFHYIARTRLIIAARDIGIDPGSGHLHDIGRAAQLRKLAKVVVCRLCPSLDERHFLSLSLSLKERKNLLFL